MRPRDLFGVALRAIAVWEIIGEGAYSLFWGFFKYRAGYPGASSATPEQHYAFAIYYITVGLLLLIFADPIVWMVYGPSKRDSVP